MMRLKNLTCFSTSYRSLTPVAYVVELSMEVTIMSNRVGGYRGVDQWNFSPDL